MKDIFETLSKSWSDDEHISLLRSLNRVFGTKENFKNSFLWFVLFVLGILDQHIFLALHLIYVPEKFLCSWSRAAPSQAWVTWATKLWKPLLFWFSGLMEILPDRCSTIAKKELIYAGTVGLICWLGGIIFINRKKTSDAKSVMADAAKAMLDDQVIRRYAH